MVLEDPEAFRVSDRRRRSAEDEPPAARGVARPEEPGTLAPEPLRATPDPGSGPGNEPEPERSLVGLFMMLANSAVISMGEAPDPVTGHRQRDLANAADAIDLLLLLREKTESHRSAEETQILDEILYDLQLRYVNATRRPGQAPAPPRS